MNILVCTKAEKVHKRSDAEVSRGAYFYANVA